MKYDVIVVGAGFAGATIASRLAEKNKRILVIDRRPHIGGNAYDYEQKGILIHKYGPHIFHTNHREVFDYLSRFTSWIPYEHRVLGHIQNKLVPIPFNFTSIEHCFEKEKAEHLKEVLLREYGEGKKVPIMELLKNEDKDVQELANFIFENVFKYYTMKQWGLDASEVDGAVTARVPVNVSYDDRYFNDTYQYMPLNGYSVLIEKMLANDNIELRLSTDVKEVLSFEEGRIFFEKEEFRGEVYYSGAIDELFDYCFGELPYRSVDLVLEEVPQTFQKAATENYPCPKEEKAFTRITEYKHFLKDEKDGVSFIHTEYPYPYDRTAEKGNIPYYVINNPKNQELYDKYLKLSEDYPQLRLIGRLAEYKYYNMDAIVLRALEMTK